MAPPQLSADRASSATPTPASSKASSVGATSNSHHPSVHPITPILGPRDLSDNFIHAFSGAAAGLVSGIVTCPLDVIKTKLQAAGGFRQPGIQGRAQSGGFTGTAKTIWRDEGIKGMYRGLGPIILGYLPTWAVYFTVYEKCKSLLGQGDRQHWVTHILSAMIAGGTSTICTNPIWVIKTRLMSQASHSTYHNPLDTGPRAPWHYNGTIDAIRKMYLYEGIGAFYSGLGPALLGLTHVAVQFPLYEQFKRMFVRNHFAGGMIPRKAGDVDFLGILAASVLSKICASSVTYPHEVLRTRLQTQFKPNGKPKSTIVNGPTGSGGGFVSGDGVTTSAIRDSLETKPSPRYVGIIKTARTVYTEEGWRAFYAGMGTNMIRAVPASAMTLLTYEMCSTYLLKRKRAAQEALALSSNSIPSP